MISSSVAERTACFDRWFGYPRASAPAVSHDGERVYLISDRTGLPHAWQVPRGGGVPTPFFGGTERVGQVVPRPDAAGTVVAVDRGGDEHYQLLLTDERGGTVRAITDDPHHIHTPGAWNRRGEFFYASNERDARFFDIYRVAVHGRGPAERIRTEDALVSVVDAADDRVLLLRSNTNLDRDLLLFEGTSETNLLPHDDEVTVHAAAFGPSRVYAAANPDREFTALVACPRNGSAPEVLAGFDGDVEQLAVAPDGAHACLGYNDRGLSRLVLVDLVTNALRDVELPVPGVVGHLTCDPEGREYYFDLSGPSLGTEVFALGASTARLRQVSAPSAPFPGPKVRPGLHEIRASDGLAVPFWSYEPPIPPKGTIVYVHGGPEAQARPSFLPLFGFLLEQGYRLIAPNVRGSTGYGRTYVHLDDVARRMDSVRDLMEVVRAVRSGTAGIAVRPDERVGVIGGSYGGFMVLAAITTYPELFDAAVDVVGISNFVTFLERTGPWRRRVREAEYGRLDRDRELLVAISPVHRADRIVTPLLVVHGENDPRVPLFEAEQIVAALRARSVPVDLLRYPNEGHGLVRRENQREAYGRAAAFFEDHLVRTSGRVP